MAALPVDAVLPELLAALRQHASAVLVAEPGAGKTTRVPLALLESVQGEVLVLEPRRLAARLPATYVAQSLGERVGERVGYQVRHDEAVGPRTKLKFITDALLLRRLLSEPTLPRVGAVVFDEFHERRLAGDLGLALLRRLQRERRPDLKLVVMSATLNPAPLARFLEDCAIIQAPGRQHPLQISHLERPDDRPLAQQVAGAVRRLITSEPAGDVLVFLPGGAEIRRADDALADAARQNDWLVVPLYGDLPPAEQDRAIRPANKRKIVLSTNVAETSITIEGVNAVVDSGLARFASHSPWSGMPVLRVRPVSRASATQRAGRAGRTGPGRVMRLFTQHDFDTRSEFEAPEIQRVDLSEALLLLAALGVHTPREFGWFAPPPEAALSAALELLHRLQALAPNGALTELGRELLRFPLHPRQARLLVEAERHGVAREACVLAALLGERDLRTDRGPARESGPSDLLALRDLYLEAERSRFAPDRLRRLGLNPGAARAVDRACSQLERQVRRQGSPARDPEQALALAILAGYPDRVAARVPDKPNELLLCQGGRARLADTSVVRDAPLVVAVDVEEVERGQRKSPSDFVVRLASAVEAEWLLELGGDAVRDVTTLEWNPRQERVDAISRLSYDALTLEETRKPAAPSDAASALLRDVVVNLGLKAFANAEALEGLAVRLEIVRTAAPESNLPSFDEAGLKEALGRACAGRTSLAELHELDLLSEVLPPAQRGLLDRLAPLHLELPSGRRLAVHYERGKPPWVESYLQDFFGMTEGPRVVHKRVAVTLHLLAPNRRPVQVTTDLAGFWSRHYPELHKQLSRRYPRHAWPDDPRHAKPPERRRG